jgi:hypothetical protein
MGTIAFIASLLFLHIVHSNNLGFSPDSMAYLEGAKNIKTGNGFIYNNGDLINHWPPLYSLILAISSFITNTDLLYTGKYLHTVLIIGVIFVFNRILNELRINKYLSIFIIVLILISAPFKIFLWQLSEGLFIFLLLSSFYCFALWLKDRSRKYLILTAIFSGLFFLTRFAGIGFIAAYILSIYFFSIGSNSKKIKNVFLFLIPLFLIITPWLLYAKFMDSDLQDGFFEMYTITGKKLGNFISVIKNWFFGSYFAVKSAPFVLILILFEIIKNRKRFFKLIPEYFIGYQRSIYVAFTLIISYTVFLFISASFFVNGIPFDNRILIPIFPFLIIIIATLLQFAFKHDFKLIFYCSIAFLLTSFATSGVPVYKEYYKNGLGFTQMKWKNSPTLDFISRDENMVYYSNANELLKLHTDKVANAFPNNSKKEQLQEVKKELENQSAQIVIIENFGWPSYLVPKNLILKEFRNFNFVNFKDGLIISGPSICK